MVEKKRTGCEVCQEGQATLLSRAFKSSFKINPRWAVGRLECANVGVFPLEAASAFTVGVHISLCSLIHQDLIKDETDTVQIINIVNWPSKAFHRTPFGKPIKLGPPICSFPKPLANQAFLGYLISEGCYLLAPDYRDREIGLHKEQSNIELLASS